MRTPDGDQGRHGRPAPVRRRQRRRSRADGHSALVDFEHRRATPTRRRKKIDRRDRWRAVEAAQTGAPEFAIEQFGDAQRRRGVRGDPSTTTCARRSSISLPVTLLILLIAFGALVAAGIPLLLAISGRRWRRWASSGRSASSSPVERRRSTTSILLIGLAVGVDYALFYLRREREERAAGAATTRALEAAAATSGRAVLDLRRHGDDRDGRHVPRRRADVHVVRDRHDRRRRAWRCSASLTVLPALLSQARRPRRQGPRPRPRPRQGARGARVGLWSRDRRPRAAPPAAVAPVAGGRAGRPGDPGARGCTLGEPGTGRRCRSDMPVVQTFDRVQDAFPSESAPADGRRQGRRRHRARGDRRASTELERADGRAAGPVHRASASTSRSARTRRSPTVDDRRPRATAPTRTSNRRARRRCATTSSRRRSARSTGVDGQRRPAATAQDARLQRQHERRTCRSCSGSCSSRRSCCCWSRSARSSIPIKAIVLNLLSVGAAYGVLVLVFQHGWVEALLGFESSGPIAPGCRCSCS